MHPVKDRTVTTSAVTTSAVSMETPKNEVGTRSAIIISLLLHGLVLTGMIWFEKSDHRKTDTPMSAVRVKLGGPKNLQPTGKKRKAPVAGVTKATPVASKKKEPPKKPKRKPKTNKKKVGLNKKKTADVPKTRKAPTKKTNRSGAASRPPVTPSKEKGPKAVGGIDGVSGTGVSVEIGDGAQNVDIDDVQFRSYFKTVVARVNSRWSRKGLRSGTTRIRFSIARDGSVSEVDIAKSSGFAYLDNPAKRAVLGADFPPLPQGYQEEFLIININFQYGAQ